MGHTQIKAKQLKLIPINWKHQFSHGGVLRNQRLGRKSRALSTKEALHVVFKINPSRLRCKSLRSGRSFLLIQKLVIRYAKHFSVKLEQVSVQGDHLHLLIRTSRRSSFHNFFRVLSGQIAQRFGKKGLLVTGTQKFWKYRPFSRVIRGFRAYQTARNYIQLNEQEARGRIPYRSSRISGLTLDDWDRLWD